MCGSVNTKVCLIWVHFLGHWEQVHKESYGRSVKHEAYAYCGGEWSGGNTGSEHPATSVRQTVVCDMNHYHVYLAYFPRMCCSYQVTGSCVRYTVLHTLLIIPPWTAQMITLYLNTQVAGPWTFFFSCNGFIAISLALKHVIEKFINMMMMILSWGIPVVSVLIKVRGRAVKHNL
jgi:hypothetical protein